MSLFKERREEISFLSSFSSWGATTVTASAVSGVHKNCLKVSGVYMKVKMKIKLKIQLRENLCKLYTSRKI
eukprot:13620493-Ditylum_brightwellii.AAC.1